MSEEPKAGLWQREFAHYLAEHRHPANKATHFVGIPLLIGTAVAGLVLLDWRLFLGGQVVGWAIQVLGHRIEGNRPVLLRRPSAFLMGPLMVLVELAGLLGARPAFAERARASVAERR
jgi:uncharacterized membrane protein YGL010W